LSIELVRSHWKATHVTGEPSTRGETIVRVLQSSTEAMRVRGVEREESGCERMKEKKREREREREIRFLADRELTF